MKREFRVPPFVWVFVGMVIGAITGWATGNYIRRVGLGTFIGAIVTAALYTIED